MHQLNHAVSNTAAAITTAALALTISLGAQRDAPDSDRKYQTDQQLMELSSSEDGNEISLSGGVAGQMALIVVGEASDAGRVSDALAAIGAQFQPRLVLWAGHLDLFGQAHVKVDLRSDAAGQQVLFQAFSWSAFDRGGLPDRRSNLMVESLRAFDIYDPRGGVIIQQPLGDRDDADRDDSDRDGSSHADADRVDSDRDGSSHADADRVDSDRDGSSHADADQINSDDPQRTSDAKAVRVHR